MKIKVICFDMDGTLIQNTDSVRYLCMLNNNLDECERIEQCVDDGSITWVESDYLKAKLIQGLTLTEAKDRFLDHIQLIQNIEEVLRFFRRKRILSVLITAGPSQVADILGAKCGFDHVYGSEYELKTDRFTGRITSHLGNDGKLQCLKTFCTMNDITLDHCVAVGDSESDIAVFEACGRSIAINYSESLKGKATEYLITDDLVDVVDVIKLWSSE